MKGMILAAGLAAVTVGGAGALIVGHGHPSNRGPCLLSPDRAESAPEPQPVVSDADSACDSCPACRSTRQVIDVVNLKTGFTESPAAVVAVSFDEPPLAKPESAVSPAKCEITIHSREELPKPRDED